MAAGKMKRVAKAARSSFRKPAPKAKPKPAKPAKKATAKPAKKAAAKPAKAKPVDMREPVGARVTLGEITTPSGTLAIFDVGLVGYLPREALEPAIVKATVPSDRPLPVVGTRVGKGRFADCWDHVSIILGDGDVHVSKKLGEAGVDFARLICMDHGALDHWQHEDSLDGKADFVFWGRDEGLLARVMSAPRVNDGYGWSGLSLADAEAKADTAARKKAENRWALATDYRPHSHHYYALAAARANPHGAGLLELAGTKLVLLFTSWGDGVFPIYLDLDHESHPVQVRIQLATEESNAAMRATNR